MDFRFLLFVSVPFNVFTSRLTIFLIILFVYSYRLVKSKQMWQEYYNIHQLDSDIFWKHLHILGGGKAPDNMIFYVIILNICDIDII